MLKVAIFGCYYGQFPVWMQYWLKSCETNPTIDFLIVTDLDLPDKPKNVHIIPLSLDEVRQLAEQKIGIPISLGRAYKLCDLRPCYGLVFEDYLKEYDYWGHCDFDLIWGDIRSFIEKYNIKKYDKFLPLGHLSLYRNTKEVNNRFRLDGSKCGSYQEVFSTDDGHAFDELDGIYSIYEKNQFPMFDKRIFAEIKTYHQRFRLKKIDKNYKHQVFAYCNGKVFRWYWEKGIVKSEEYIYIHFRRKLPADDRTWQELNDFYITKDGFFDLKEIPASVSEIEKYNMNPGFIVEAGETISFVLKNIGKIKAKIENEIIARRQRIKR